jgi:tetratricopeptide (TPR) repeat protein
MDLFSVFLASVPWPSNGLGNAVFLAEVPVEIRDGAVAIPTEVLVAAGFGAMLWAFKWLAAREFKRFEEILDKHDRAIEVLQKSDATQQFDLTQIARLEARQEQIARELADDTKSLAALPRLLEQVERLQTENGQLAERVQRLDNVKLVLRQTQEALQVCQKEILTLRAEVATGYISEEKYVREMTTLTSRIDAVWERIDNTLGHRGQRFLEPQP